MRRESVKRSKKTWKTSCPSGQVTRDVQVSVVPVEADMYERKFQAGAMRCLPHCSQARANSQPLTRVGNGIPCNAGRIMSLPHDSGTYIFEPAAARLATLRLHWPGARTSMIQALRFGTSRWFSSAPTTVLPTRRQN